MILSRANWTNRNAPWRESFCTCAVLSILVAAPALLMINFLDPQLVLLGLSILLFSDAMIAALLAWAKSGNATLENVTAMGCCRSIDYDGLCRSDPWRTRSSGTAFRATGRTTFGAPDNRRR